MPKAPMTEIETQTIQNQIIEASLDIIANEGYENISMRKIATTLNISATKIYNYFKNKDELYLRVMAVGYEHFYEYIESKIHKDHDIISRIRQYLNSIISYYYEKQNFYSLLFIQYVPRTEDFSGNINFHVALLKHDTGVKFFNLLCSYLREYILINTLEKNDEWINGKAILIISQIHGALCLHNNHLINEVTNKPDQVILSSVDLIINTLDA